MESWMRLPWGRRLVAPLCLSHLSFGLSCCGTVVPQQEPFMKTLSLRFVQSLAFLITLILAQASAHAANLIANGNFSAGNTGFTSGYSYSATSVFNDGTYGVDTNPHNLHPGGSSYVDHTTGTGNMMIVNGVLNTTAWQESIPVTPNTSYDFNAWFSEWGIPASNAALIQVTVNSVAIAPNYTVETPNGTWGNYDALWASGASTTAIIKISDVNPLGSTQNGNDFAIDDISFTAVPEPASLSLLALGGVMLMTRRTHKRTNIRRVPPSIG